MTIFKPLFLAASLLLLTASVSFSAPRCLIVGDSIAVGLSWHLKLCPVIAKVGISSKAVLNRTKPATILIVSAGSNDPTNGRLEANLMGIRERSKAKTVIWIFPQHRRAAALVRKVAHMHGDQLVTFIASRDGVHPKSYKRLARHVASNLHLLLERL